MTDKSSTSESTKVHVLVPAAGIGQRFGGPVPKQYISLCGKPIIQHSLECLLEIFDQISVAISDEDDYWDELEIAKDSRIRRVVGGETRAESVRNALKSISDAKGGDWVLIHDAVRPLVSASDINRLISKLSEHPCGGLLGTPVYETVKRVSTDGDVLRTEDREGLWTAQTPQLFRFAALLEAMDSAEKLDKITDEASAMETAGHKLLAVEGSPMNIKITRQADLEFAELILNSRSNNSQTNNSQTSNSQASNSQASNSQTGSQQ